ncbi:MAG: hypothetical protein QOH99_32 [Frankiaceae bacterium]|nr:hypothetical protein [Frankiaceae bacterium]
MLTTGDLSTAVRPPDVTAHVHARRTLPRRATIRAALAAVGIAQIAVAVFAVVHGLDAAAHDSHELASLDIAIGVGFVTAAYKPWRSAGLLPLAVVAAFLLWITAMGDIADGETALGHELQHLLTVGGCVLLALAIRPPRMPAPSAQPARRPPRRPHLRVIRAAALAWLGSPLHSAPRHATFLKG